MIEEINKTKEEDINDYPQELINIYEKYKGNIYSTDRYNGDEYYNIRMVKEIVKICGLPKNCVYYSGTNLSINFEVIDNGGYGDMKDIISIYNFSKWVKKTHG